MFPSFSAEFTAAIYFWPTFAAHVACGVDMALFSFYECQCICCSFHLNYPVADLLVTTCRLASYWNRFVSRNPQSNAH